MYYVKICILCEIDLEIFFDDGSKEARLLGAIEI